LAKNTKRPRILLKLPYDATKGKHSSKSESTWSESKSRSETLSPSPKIWTGFGLVYTVGLEYYITC